MGDRAPHVGVPGDVSTGAPLPALAVLTAAGSGTRLGCEGPKALVRVGRETMVEAAARGLAEAGVAALVVTAPADAVEDFRALMPHGHAPGHTLVPVVVVAGGASRQASVAAGLAALPEAAALAGVALEDDTPVLVHDAARCLVPVGVVLRVLAAVRAGHVAVVPGLSVTDTLKEVGTAGTAGHGASKESGDRAAAVGTGEGAGTCGDAGADAHAGGCAVEVRPVVATPDRSRLVAVQTPQGFRWDVLRRAHARGADRAATEATAATDDAGLVEEDGGAVVVVAGDPLALKVTTAMDLALARMLAREDG